MATFALDDATIWVHGYDFTTDLNQIGLNVSAEELDGTTFGPGKFRSRVGGMRSVEAQLAGFWQSAASAAVDPQAFPDLGVADRVVTVAPTSAEGSTAYFFQGGKFTYELFGTQGELTPFSLGVRGTNAVGVVRGQVAKAKGNVSAIGATGSGVNLGAVASGQFLYGSLHVFTPGTTITAVLESAAASNFTGATTRATFGPITTAGGTWATRLAGPITDPWYRLRVTAVTGTFSLAGAIGIGS